MEYLVGGKGGRSIDASNQYSHTNEIMGVKENNVSLGAVVGVVYGVYNF